ARRDFTMNALYADAEGNVIDPLGGLADLSARLVRFVGDPDARIREDYLRILRFFRFHAWFGDPDRGMDVDALAACAEHARHVARLSRERIGHEMRRLLDAPDPGPAMAAMQATGVLSHVLAGADSAALGPLLHLEGAVPPYWLRRLAAIGGESPEKALRLTNAEARHLRLLCDGLREGEPLPVLAYRHGAHMARDVALLRPALIGGALPDGWIAEIEKGATARFPVRAADLMPSYEGPALGTRLAELERRWIASGFELSREQLLA
ncbi:MAG: CCA tRNA nucleotidyltransferase, partial [Rhodobacteraceae bacterium]|nr:CCA tRNA nucleotidyltransferase [Paracoccaceae bacterium]